MNFGLNRHGQPKQSSALTRQIFTPDITLNEVPEVYFNPQNEEVISHDFALINKRSLDKGQIINEYDLVCFNVYSNFLELIFLTGVEEMYVNQPANYFVKYINEFLKFGHSWPTAIIQNDLGYNYIPNSNIQYCTLQGNLVTHHRFLARYFYSNGQRIAAIF
jgi:hypothetical protein